MYIITLLYNKNKHGNQPQHIYYIHNSRHSTSEERFVALASASLGQKPKFKQHCSLYVWKWRNDIRSLCRRPLCPSQNMVRPRRQLRGTTRAVTCQFAINLFEPKKDKEFPREIQNRNGRKLLQN